MKLISKVLTVVMFATLTAASAVDGTCEAKVGMETQASLCKAQSPAACAAHSNVCEIRKGEKACAAKAGMEIHEDFCKPLSRNACQVHSNFCKWD